MTQFSKSKQYWQLCDMCGFRYHAYEMGRSSYRTVRCPECNDGAFDLRNHPQNGPFPVLPDPLGVPDPRPDTDIAISPDATEGEEMLPLPEGGVGDNP